MSSAHSQIQKINDLITLQLKDPLGPSFHDSYKDSCYIFVGGLDIRMTEGDVMIVFSQWGEIVDINLIRDRETGEPKGFGFLAYEDQRSTVLAVDNGNGMRLLNRTLKVDHVRNYAVFLKGEGAEQEARTREQSSPENELKNEVKNEVKEERGQELRDKEVKSGKKEADRTHPVQPFDRVRTFNPDGTSHVKEERYGRERSGREWGGRPQDGHRRDSWDGSRRGGWASRQDERIWRNSPPQLPQSSLARRRRP